MSTHVLVLVLGYKKLPSLLLFLTDIQAMWYTSKKDEVGWRYGSSGRASARPQVQTLLPKEKNP
jgi:hypothetical protein